MNFGSTSVAKIEKSLQTVRTSLENEITYEKENYESIKEIDEFLEQSGFKVISPPGEHVIQIYKGNIIRFLSFYRSWKAKGKNYIRKPGT
jgi:hypothetical protein